MAGLLYYLPKLTRDVQWKDLPALGVGHAFDGDGFCPCEILAGGPDSGNGVVIADSKTVSKVGYYKDQQTWRKIPGSDAWVGMVTDSLPNPADLVRDQVLSGHLVKLADGKEWLVPIARGSQEEGDELRWTMSLPTAPTTVDEDGKWVRGDVSETYRPLWEIAMRFWDAWFAAEEIEGEDKATILFDDLNDAALLALATNYRVGKAETSLLGLFDSSCITDILLALIDWPTRLAWSKKKQDADGLSSADGEAD